MPSVPLLLLMPTTLLGSCGWCARTLQGLPLGGLGGVTPTASPFGGATTTTHGTRTPQGTLPTPYEPTCDAAFQTGSNWRNGAASIHNITGAPPFELRCAARPCPVFVSFSQDVDSCPSIVTRVFFARMTSKAVKMCATNMLHNHCWWCETERVTRMRVTWSAQFAGVHVGLCRPAEW